MNLHDAQRMVEVLFPLGYRLTDHPEQATLIIVNTCSVREKPQAKVISALGRFRALKDKNPELLLGVAGFVAQQEGDKLFEVAPFIDMVLGPDHIRNLPELVTRAKDQRQLQVGFIDAHGYNFLRATPLPGQNQPIALVTIQKGCDNYCSYCIVPYVRGPEVSRPASEILDEIRDLVSRGGAKEVTLIGQNVNSYHGYEGKSSDFVMLLRAVDTIEGIERIRFTTSHPKDMSHELCNCFAELEHLCPWLHLPVQSGSTEILRRMNRGYSREDYLRLTDKVRTVCPHIALGTDLIVGYPGETEGNFGDTLSLLEQIQYNYCYSFKYSVRPRTAAAAVSDDVPEEEKSLRLHKIQMLQDKHTRSALAAVVGKEESVMIEGPSRRGLPQVCGRTPGNQVVNFTMEPAVHILPGQIVRVLITEAGSHSLTGQLL
jgi:tRNA-2-methylthio-N6-dimethylallyladenosine synthase